VAPTRKPRVIAIDGPAAAGKGTLARRLAEHLGFAYLDTGLLYRAVGRRVLDRGEMPSDPAAAEQAAGDLRPEDLERGDLRGPDADAAAAAVASVPKVRAALLAFQRGFGAGTGAVLDGRDIGTVVFPDAALKLFVVASPAARARRRWLELRDRGIDAEIAEVEREIRARDRQDAARAIAPLRAADDAVTIDTTDLDRDAAFAAVLDVLRTRCGGPAAVQRPGSAAKDATKEDERTGGRDTARC
jgi:cytidylate kinase